LIAAIRRLSDARIRWQCRRGTKELDQLLLGWFDTQYGRASERQKSAFHALLELQDPELIEYLIQGAKPASPELAEVVNAICRSDSP
jgi:antitoxin CptB